MKPIDLGKSEYGSISREDWEKLQRDAKPLSELLKRKKKYLKEKNKGNV